MAHDHMAPGGVPARQGAFVVFCGLDGSGKTTQAELLAARLRRDQLPVSLTRQPSTWYLGDAYVRDYFARGEQDIHGLAALALFSAADRARHLSEVVLPAMHAGQIVISSRYVFSAYAYFFARGLRDQAWLETINRYAVEPDMTFFLDVTPEQALERSAARGEAPKAEEADLARMRQVRERFLSFASERFRVLDGALDPQTLHARVVPLVTPMLERKGLSLPRPHAEGARGGR